MQKTMFIFRKRTLSAVPNVNGTDVDFLSIPKDSLVSLNMIQGYVIMYFVNGNSYSHFTGGTTNIRGYEYAQVTLAVNTDQELSVIYRINDALSQDRNNITFDNVNSIFDIDDVTSISSIKRFESLSILDTDPSAGGLPSGTTNGEIIQWSVSANDWVIAPYVLPIADGSAGEVLITDGLGAVSFTDISTIQVTGVSVLAASWSLVGSFYETDIANANIEATSIVDVIPYNVDYSTVTTAQMLPETTSSAGSVKIYAVNLPAADITVTLNISRSQ